MAKRLKPADIPHLGAGDGPRGECPLYFRGMDGNLVGIGLYTIRDASRLLRVPTRDVARWMFGYEYQRAEARHRIPPVAGEQRIIDDQRALSFFELLELRLIRELRHHNVSLQAIRLAIQRAREAYEHPHPFVIKRIATDGKSIFAEAANATEDQPLLDLLKRQYAINQVINDSLVAGVVFGEDGEARAWHPVPNDRVIILDPSRSFGKPIIDAAGVPTWTLFDAYVAEGRDADRVARIYDVSREAVKKAVEFESALLH